jgi:hypothetical protein
MVRANDSRAVERYVATANLAAVLEEQGRKQSWLAERLRISKSLLCLIIGGAKTVDRARGQQIADALGVPFGLLFKLRSRRNSVADARRRPASATIASDPISPRLVVRQGDRQRVLRPPTAPRHDRAPQPDTGGRAPPRKV